LNTEDIADEIAFLIGPNREGRVCSHTLSPIPVHVNIYNTLTEIHDILEFQTLDPHDPELLALDQSHPTRATHTISGLEQLRQTITHYGHEFPAPQTD
jgi:hypothetical protein